MRTIRLLAGLIGLGLALAGPARLGAPRAHAAESDAVNKAREHYKNGEKAFKANRYEEALREWEAGYQLSNRPLFLLNIGHAERRRGQLGNARTMYKRFLLMEPESKLRGEIEGVLREIDSTLAAEESAGKGEATAAAAPAPAVAPALDPTPAAADGAAGRAAGAPAPPPTPAALVAQLAASDPKGALGTSAAGPDLASTSVTANAGPPVPIYRRWWFWAGAGTVAAVGVLSGVLLLRGDSYTKQGSIGTLGSPQ